MRTVDKSFLYVSAMEFRVLGPVEVVAAAERLDLGGPKQRTVLALLVANAGRSVSTERLIDAAYGDNAPDAARRSVQTYISNLRSVVGDMIKSVPSGYEFRPVDSWVDAEQFVAHTEAGRALMEDDPTEASSTLQEALALWRGLPFSDIEARGELDAEITRLNELRLVALESRIDADLAAGRDRELVGELEALTVEHPFRESFHSQQMLALYRSGRQAEALRAYTRMRENLAEELGVDPSPELRRLEQRILEQDPTLALAPKSAVRRRAVLVVDLAAGIDEALGAPDDRRQTLIDLDRIVAGSVEDAGGTVAAQRATATYATFDDVRSAMQAAEQATKGSPTAANSPIVRLSVDVGDVEEEPTGAISGPTVIRAAGLVAAANPGQILLSSDAHRAAADDAAGGWAMRALGRHSVARLGDPEPVYQLLVEGLPDQFPPLSVDAEPPELPAGRIGVPGYELRDEIGRGVFGTVYRAYQASVGREVAVKAINPELANDPGFIRRFAVEAKMISRIEHPNVVPLYDFWRGPDGALLVMRLMSGGNLADYAGAAGLDRDGLLRMVDQVGGALATAHSLGIAHGDVQPSNVLLNESGDFFLSDFGIASEAPRDRLAQELDTASFASMTEQAAALLVLTDNETALLEEARRGGFANTGELLLAWRSEIGAAEASATYTPTRNPYKGLAAFGELDAPDFHGRDSVTDELVAAVAGMQLVAAVGPSGVGKSSVVRAGLLPKLRDGAVAGSAEWLVADCTPGSHPFERLASALVRVASTAPHDLEEMLLASDRGLIKAVDRFLPASSELLLIVDQFEELFTLTKDESERDKFQDLLAASVQDSSSRIRVLVTMRADFFDRPLRHPAFGELLRAGTVPISAPTDDEMRAIIENPATGVGVEFESGLVERIVAEVHGEAGALPLVEFALTEMFEQRDSDLLTLRSYTEAGGVIAALGRRAEGIFSGLDEERQDVARKVFMRLVTPGEEGSDTRRRVRRSELDRIGVPADMLDGVLGAFGEHRLLTFDRDEVTHGATVEVAHEALIREWSRLKGWIDTNREELILRGRLAAAVSDWEQAGRAEEYLLAGGRLSQHESWTETTELTLSDAERELLAKSRAAENERRARRRRTRQLVLGGFAAAAVVALILSAFALNARRDADDRRLAAEQAESAAEEQATLAQQERDRAATNADLAEANEAQAVQQQTVAEGRALLASVPNIIDDDPQLALLLSLEAADRLGDIPPATAALHQSITSERTLYEVSGDRGDISPDGNYLAVMGPENNTVEVHDINAAGLLWSHTFEVDAPEEYEFFAKFVNEGSELVTGVAWLPGEARALDPPSAEIGFHVWDTATGDLKRRMDSGPCGPLGYYLQLQYGYVLESSDAWLVAGSISDEWFAANGCRGWDANPLVDVHRVDATTGERVPIYSGWDTAEFGLEVALSGDGRRAVLGVFVAPQGVLKVVDVETGDLIQTITPPPLLAGVGMNHDGSIAVSAGDVGHARLYDVESGEFLFELPAPDTGSSPSGTWFSEDGSLIYVPHFDGVIRLYDTTSGALVDELPPIDDVATLTQVTADNQRVVVFGGGIARVSALGAADTAEVAHFNPCGPTAPDTFFMNRGLAVHEELVTTYAYCDFDGGSYDKQPTAFTYVLATGELVATHRTSGQRFAVIDDSLAAMEMWTEQPDGTVVAGKVSVVDLRSGEIIDTLPDICNWSWDAYFDENSLDCVDGSGIGFNNEDIVMSKDRNVLAIGTEESPGAAWAWNLSNGVFVELGDPVAVMALSPDETRLAASEPVALDKGAEGALRLYSTDTFEVLSEVSTAGEPFGRNGIDFTRDGASIVGITNSGLVRFHDAATLDETAVIAPHEVGARDIDLNLGGDLMATVGLDGFARVWDLDTLTLLHEIEVGGLPTAVAFAAEDSQLVVTTRHGGVHVFHLELDNILDEARSRLRRGFTEDECRVYFPDGDCPTIDETG